jgi:hypothetical protein
LLVCLLRAAYGRRDDGRGRGHEKVSARDH